MDEYYNPAQNAQNPANISRQTSIKGLSPQAFSPQEVIRKEPEMQQVLSRLAVNVDQLIKMVDILDDRLAPVLRQMVSPKPEGANISFQAPICNRIAESNLGIEGSLFRLQRLLDCLEI